MREGAGERILVVEDDRSVTRVVSAALRARGYAVAAAATGQSCLAAVERDDPAVVLLDLGLPDIDGVDLCRQLRGWSSVPIIVVTADGADDRKVEALDQGADDYVTKPFSMPELLARIRVALRHRRAAGVVDHTVLEVGDLRIDVPHHRVSVAGAVVDLSPKEFALLTLLARHAGRVLTHRAILEEVWGPGNASETQYLRVYVGLLRKKLNDHPDRPRVVTEPGIGYRLVDPSDPVTS
jgi:two-component system KDP operon response regulator KdpE